MAGAGCLPFFVIADPREQFFVFHRAVGNRNPNAAYTKFKWLLKKNGLPEIKLHDLRHTFATHAIALGVDEKTLAGVLGHTKPSFTLDRYTHVTSEMQERAADIMDDALGKIFGKELKA